MAGTTVSTVEGLVMEAEQVLIGYNLMPEMKKIESKAQYIFRCEGCLFATQ